MSEPVHVFNVQVYTNQSMVASSNSLPLNIDECVSYCVHAKFTGAPVGELKIQGSNDPAILGYDDITDSISAVTEAGGYILNVELPAYSFIRLVYTATSGTGTINAKINAKRR